MINESALVGLGDPLLDITAQVDHSFLQKFELLPYDCIMAGSEQEDIQKELITNYPVAYTVGGATSNTLSVFQWIIGKPNASTMIGCIGEDRFGIDFQSECVNSGVRGCFQYSSTESTGTCCVLLTENASKRSLVTHKDASGCFTIGHIKKPETQECLKMAKCIYVSCFFLMGNLDTVLAVAEQARNLGQIFCLNLSAPFIVHSHNDKIKQVLPFVDILFCNDSEAESFALAMHINNWDSRIDLSKQIASGLKAGGRVVITQGHDPVISATLDSVQTWPVPRLPNDKVRDTNGAGDAFVAGYLASMLSNKNLGICVQNGILAGVAVVQRLGCTVPIRKSVEFLEL